MPDVVFLPGFMQHADTWTPVAAAVGESYPVRMHEFTTWTFDARLAELEAFAGSVVVGYSMGGRLALHAATQSQFAAVITIGSSAGIDDDTVRSARRESDEELADWIEAHPIEAVVKRWEQNPVFASQPPELVAAQRPGRLNHSPDDLAGLLRTAGQGALVPIWDQLGSIHAPVLALAGENDPTYRVAAERIGRLVPRGDSAVIDAAGHAAHLENPDATAAAIRTWLDRLQTEPPIG